MTDSLAIITVTYENYALTDDLIACFRKQTNSHFRIYVVDTSKHKIDAVYPDYAITIPSLNKGYANAVNIGIKAALQDGYKYFVVINNDTRVNSDFVSSILRSLENHPHSIIGGKIYYEAGYEYHKDKYKKTDLGNVLWYAGGDVDWNHALTPHRGVNEVDIGRYNTILPTQFVNGCLMIYDKVVFEKVGIWDESYFLYFEDADFCERAKRKGVSLIYDPSVKIWHKISQSTGGSGSKLHAKYQEINRIKFCLKYGPIKTSIHLIINYISKFLRIKYYA